MKLKSGLAACLVVIATATCPVITYADTAQDKAITDQVNAAIVKNPDIGTEINVSTKGGIVYLKGKTSTVLTKSHAEELAKAVPGVQQVVNNIGTEK